MSRVKIPKKVSAGFHTDINMLLRKFMSVESLRYNAFSKVWREAKFSLVFCGRKDRELRLFFEEIVPIILQLWLPTCSFRERVFGLYMLYAVYTMQPTIPKLKIRLRLSDWEQSEVLLRIASREQHLDACYLLYRMRLERCFHCVALLRQRSPVMHHGQEEDISTLAAASAKVFSPLERMTKSGTLQQLSLIHRQYVTMKSVQETPEVRDLAIVKEDVYEGVCREVAVLQAKYRTLQEQAAASSRRVKEKRSSNRGESVAVRRQRLRRQQFRTVAKTRKGTRFEQLLHDDAAASKCDDESILESAESTSPVAKRAKKQPVPRKKSQASKSASAAKGGKEPRRGRGKSSSEEPNQEGDQATAGQDSV